MYTTIIIIRSYIQVQYESFSIEILVKSKELHKHAYMLTYKTQILHTVHKAMPPYSPLGLFSSHRNKIHYWSLL